MANYQKGVTLTEALISVAILSMVVFFARIAVLFINNMLQTSSRSQVQQEAQLTLYSITKEVRNCRNIVQASSDTLKLHTLNTALGYNIATNPVLFDPVSVATVTYTYTKTPSESYLRKTVERNGMVVEDKKLLRNLLVTPDATNYMFNPCSSLFVTVGNCPPPWDPLKALPPYDVVDIRLRMSPSFTKGANTEYATKEMRRSNAQ